MDLEQILAQLNTIGNDLNSLLQSLPSIDGLDYCAAYAWFSSFGDPNDPDYDDPFMMYSQIMASLSEAFMNAAAALEQYVTPEDGLGALNQTYGLFEAVDFTLQNLAGVVDY